MGLPVVCCSTEFNIVIGYIDHTLDRNRQTARDFETVMRWTVGQDLLVPARRLSTLLATEQTRYS